MNSQFTRFLDLPRELKTLILQKLALKDLVKAKRASREIHDIIDHPAVLKSLFFQIDSLDLEDRDKMLWDSYYYLKPEVQCIHPLDSIIQKFKTGLNIIDQLGASAIQALEVEGADVLGIKKEFCDSMLGLLEPLLPFFGYRGSMLIFYIRQTKEMVSHSITLLDTSPSALSCIETIKSLLKRVKGVYLCETISNQQEDSLNMLFFGAIALTPEWHQLVLDDSRLHWERVIKSQTQKTPALIFRLLKQPVFQAFIGNDDDKLLDFIKLPKQPFFKDPAIALKIYDYCVEHYNSDVKEAVFNHYDALYPEVFKPLKEASHSNDLEREQSMTLSSFSR